MNRKLRCAVIDDEPLAVELMESYVRRTPFLQLEGSFGSGTAAFEALHENPVELLYCDIQMPELNGMDLTRMLPPATRVIFTTAFDRYAVEGFRVNALDYLLKPISYADFLAASQKALAWFEMQDRAQRPQRHRSRHPQPRRGASSSGPSTACGRSTSTGSSTSRGSRTT